MPVPTGRLARPTLAVLSLVARDRDAESAGAGPSFKSRHCRRCARVISPYAGNLKSPGRRQSQPGRQRPPPAQRGAWHRTRPRAPPRLRCWVLAVLKLAG